MYKCPLKTDGAIVKYVLKYNVANVIISLQIFSAFVEERYDRRT